MFVQVSSLTSRIEVAALLVSLTGHLYLANQYVMCRVVVYLLCCGAFFGTAFHYAAELSLILMI